jgi:hypothetical protein
MRVSCGINCSLREGNEGAEALFGDYGYEGACCTIKGKRLKASPARNNKGLLVCRT